MIFFAVFLGLRSLSKAKRHALPAPSESSSQPSTLVANLNILSKLIDHDSDEISQSSSLNNDHFDVPDAFPNVDDPMAQVEQEMMSIADTHLGVQMVLQGDRKQGMELLFKAAKAGNAEAMFNLGVLHEEDGKDATALKFYQASSNLDYAAAFYNLAVFHEYGKADLKPCTETAIELYKRAAELGLDEARKALVAFGVFHSEVEGKESKNDQMSPKQLYHLAKAYHYGLFGVKEDKHYAAELYRIAGERGHRRALQAYRQLLEEFLAQQRAEEHLHKTELMMNGF